MIEYDEIRTGGLHLRVYLFGLAAAYEQSRVWRPAIACNDSEHIRAGGMSQRGELAQLILAGRRPHANARQQCAFATAWTLKQLRTPRIRGIGGSSSFAWDSSLRTFVVRARQ